MKIRALHLTSLFLLAGLLASKAGAAPPTLEPAGELPASIQMGQGHLFRMIYRHAAGDRPRDLTLVLVSPSGTTRLRGEPPRTGDFRSGVPVEWRVSFPDAGPNRIHFEYSSVTDPPNRVERWPKDAREPLVLTVINPVTQWVMLGVGLGVSLLVLPMLVFFVLRGMSRRMEPGATARFALLIGVLAGAAWYGYLFWNIHGVTSIAIAGVIALGAVFLLATMRR